MGSDVGQIFPTASLHRDLSISYALVCEKEISHMGQNNKDPDLVSESGCLLQHTPIFLLEPKYFNGVWDFAKHFFSWQSI